MVTQGAVYTAGMLAGRLVALALVPIYTRHLGPEAYGLLELLDTTDQVLVVASSAAVADAVLRHWHDAALPSSTISRDRVESTAVLSLVATGALVALVGALLARPLASLLLHNPAHADLIVITFGSVVFQSVVEVPLSVMRGNGRAGAFVGWTLARMTLGFALNVALVVGLGMGVRGMALSGLLASALVTTALVVVTLRRTGLGFDPRHALTMARFGWPLVPGALSLIALQHGRSYVLSAHVSMAVVGLWGLGLRLGSMMSQALGAPIRNAWTAQMYSLWSSENGPARYTRGLTVLVALYAWAATALSTFGREIILVVGGTAYLGAAVVVPGVVASYALREVAELFRAGLVLGRNPRPIAWIEPSLAILDLGVSMVLVGRYGIHGAALAAPLTFTLYAVALGVAAQRVLGVRFEVKAFCLLALIGVGCTAVGLATPFATLPATLGWKALWALVVWPLVTGWVVFRSEEDRAVMRSLRQKALGW